MTESQCIVLLICVATFSLAAGACNGETCSGGCVGGRECVSGSCLLPCVDHAGCDSGTVCFQGFCEQGTLRFPDGDAAGGDAPGGDGPGTDGALPEYCGNDVVETGEQCDGSDLGSVVDCSAAGYGAAGSVGCLVTCAAHDLSGCSDPPSSCGNGSINGREQCDGNRLSVADCVALGFSGGTLACNGNCSFDVGACTGP